MTAPATVWQNQAACAGMNPDLFFPDAGGAGAKAAKAICHVCPVEAECLQYALDNDERHGIFGGTTPRERQRLRRGLPRRKRPFPHGTTTGYAKHIGNGETPCWACNDARSRWGEGRSHA